MIPRLHVPLLEPEDVVRHLGKQEKHWKQGRSAHALAYAWRGQEGFPQAIDLVFKSHPTFQGAKLIDAFLERQTDLGSAGRHSQTDLLAVVSLDKGLGIVAVEGKAGEPFGKYVREWLEGEGSKGGDPNESKASNRELRLRRLCETLHLSSEAASPLRYQLLHRAASAIYEAKRYRTDNAVLLIHSFSDDKKGFADFSTFLQTLGFEAPAPGVLAGPIRRDGVSLYAGWAQDEAPPDESPGAYLASLRNYAARMAKDCKRIRTWCDEQQAKR